MKLATTSNMIYRYLGHSGLRVSALSYGNWLTQHDANVQKTATTLTAKCYENGINFYDSAEGYGSGIAEKVLGNSIKELNLERESLVLSTKVFFGGQGPNDIGLSRKHVIEGVNKSLKRLQLDYLDIVFCHRPDYITPLEETCRAMNHLIDSGKILYWGTSEWPAQRILEAYGICDKLGLIRPIAEQPQYNMLHRERFEVEYGVLFDDYKMGSTIWSPLAQGILSGKYLNKVEEDSRYAKASGRAKDRFDGMMGEKTDAKLKSLQEVAEELGGSLSQLALAWALYNKNVSTAIFGASKMSQLEDNLKAIEMLGKFNKEIEEKVNKILDNTPEPSVDFKTGKPSKPRR